MNPVISKFRLKLLFIEQWKQKYGEMPPKLLICKCQTSHNKIMSKLNNALLSEEIALSGWMDSKLYQVLQKFKNFLKDFS